MGLRFEADPVDAAVPTNQKCEHADVVAFELACRYNLSMGRMMPLGAEYVWSFSFSENDVSPQYWALCIYKFAYTLFLAMGTVVQNAVGSLVFTIESPFNFSSFPDFLRSKVTHVVSVACCRASH